LALIVRYILEFKLMKIIKVLLIISVVLAAMFFSSIYILHEWFMYPPEYDMQIQQLIERGYLNADFTYSEKIDFFFLYEMDTYLFRNV
jgi:phage shock protein PspC (stress-responsive transcriptional regulator)